MHPIDAANMLRLQHLYKLRSDLLADVRKARREPHETAMLIADDVIHGKPSKPYLEHHYRNCREQLSMAQTGLKAVRAAIESLAGETAND